MSFRVRIALISATAVAVAFAAAAWVTYGTAQRELIAEVDVSLQERIEQIEQSTNPIELIAVLGAFDERLPRGPFERGVRGFDAIFWQFVPSGAGRAITDFPGEGGMPFGPAEQAVLEGVGGFPIFPNRSNWMKYSLSVRLMQSCVSNDWLRRAQRQFRMIF